MPELKWVGDQKEWNNNEDNWEGGVYREEERVEGEEHRKVDGE